MKELLKNLIEEIEDLDFGKNPYDEYWFGVNDATNKIIELIEKKIKELGA